MSLGQRIKVSRQAMGLSLRDLESKIDNRVSAQAISKYERDESVPSSGVLSALAEALGVSEDYLVSNTDIVLESVDFRKKSFTSAKEKNQVEAKVLDFLERYLTVEDILGLPTVNWDMPREAPWPILNDLVEVEQAALNLRLYWRVGKNPIPNLVVSLEDRGIKILSIPLSDNIEGLTARVSRNKRKSTSSVIVVNRNEWGERQRFTIAHELGHMVLEVGSRVDEEKAAHRFAGAFLMPAETLRSEIGKFRKSMGWSELFELKRLFGVSVQALTYRCMEIGIFNRSLFQYLFNEFKRRGWRTFPYKEPYAIEKEEEPTRFQRLCYRALAENLISEAKTAELLGLSVHELIQQMDKPPNSEETSEK